jgi:hypothetical protein
MKSTENFKKVISEKLSEMAANDQLFAESFRKPSKNIDDCITYILNSVKSSGCNGFTDDEIFGMAAHYYDEDNINIGKPINCNVVVNHAVELTQEEIELAKNEAKERVIAKESERLQRKPTVKKTEPNSPQQQSLF